MFGTLSRDHGLDWEFTTMAILELVLGLPLSFR
jgi:hypothetical protein